MAEIAGTSQVYVSELENAKRAVSIDIVEKLAKGFGVDAVELLSPSARALESVVYRRS